MITVKLLGGSKRSFGSDKIEFDKKSLVLSDLLSLLQNMVQDGRPSIDTGNIIIAINGVDSSVLNGNKTLVTDGDVISIIPVVHGGTKLSISFRISNSRVELFRLGKNRVSHRRLLDDMRARYPSLLIQGVRAKYVLSSRHARRVIEVSLEAQRVGTMLSKKTETDMLMRFAATRQISGAIDKAGMREGEDSILIVIGKKPLVNKLCSEIGHALKPVEPFPKNDAFLKKEFGIRRKELGCVLSANPIEDLLVERSSVLIR